MLIMFINHADALAGDQSGGLGVWDARASTSEAEEDEDEPMPATGERGKVYYIPVHKPPKGTISSVQVDPTDTNVVGSFSL